MRAEAGQAKRNSLCDTLLIGRVRHGRAASSLRSEWGDLDQDCRTNQIVDGRHRGAEQVDAQVCIRQRQANLIRKFETERNRCALRLIPAQGA